MNEPTGAIDPAGQLNVRRCLASEWMGRYKIQGSQALSYRASAPYRRARRIALD